MTPDSQSALIVALVGILVGVVGVALGAYAVARMNRLHRSYALLQAGEGRETIVDVMGRTIEEFHELQDEVARLQARTCRPGLSTMPS